jgi:hypothetical protein
MVVVDVVDVDDVAVVDVDVDVVVDAVFCSRC